MIFEIENGILKKVITSPDVKSVTLPSGIDTIADYALFHCSNIDTLIVNEGVKTIGNHAFGISNISNLVLPLSVRNICQGCLETTKWYRRQNQSTFVMANSVYLYKYRGNDQTVIVPDGVRYIGECAFSGSQVKSVILPDSVEVISEKAFFKCANLEEIRLGSGLKEIGGAAFYGCKLLAKINLPESIESIGNKAFAETPWLKNYQGDYIIAGNCLLCYRGNDEEIILPENVKHICDCAFVKSSSIKRIALPEGIASIGSYAFSYLDNLQFLSVPSTVKRISDYAFSYMDTQQLEIHIPEEIPLNSITDEKKTFCNCKAEAVYAPHQSLKEFTVLKKQAAIGNIESFMQGRHVDSDVLAQCKKYIKSQRKRLYIHALSSVLLLKYMCLEKIITLSDIDKLIADADNDVETKAILIDYKNNSFTFEDEEKLMMSELNRNPLSISEMKKIWSYKTLENGTLVITSYKGEGGDVRIPSSIGQNVVSAIGSRAFAAHSGATKQIQDGRLNIRSVVIPDTVTSIGSKAFSGCKNLTKVVLPDSVTEIGGAAFWLCENLQEIALPDRITIIEDSTFRECLQLTYVKLPKALKRIGNNAFMLCRIAEFSPLHYGIEYIGQYAFYGCRNIKEIVIPGSVKTLTAGALIGLHNVERIVLSQGVECLRDFSICGCSNLKELHLPPSINSIGNNLYKEFTGNVLFYVHSHSYPFYYFMKNRRGKCVLV